MAELNLTKKQTSEYLDHVEKETGDRFAYAGTAATHNHCPLALAYRHHHPKAVVSFNGEFADVDGHQYDYRNWQKRFIEESDQLSSGYRDEVEVTADYARSLLGRV